MALTQATPDVVHNVQSNITQVGTLSNLTVSGAITAGNLSVIGTTTLSTSLAIASGGTGATTAATALDNLLPSGEQTGYVLATTGAGSYFWTNPSTGGSTIGQQLTTTRQANTATAGQSVFTLVSGRSYTPGTGQLRVYLNGVRQYPSEYTETSNVSYTITGGVSNGDLVLAEIDQFSSFNNYANLTYASNVGNIAAEGLTVQSAIASLETNKAPLANPVFSNNVEITGSIIQNNVVGGIVPVGGIIMWSGSIASIPTRWSLCNGSNGTPDLRDRFIVGAGSTYAPGATGGSADAIVPSHTHTASSVVTDPGHAHGIAVYATATNGGLAKSSSGGTLNGTPTTTSATTGITVATTVTTAGESVTNKNLPPYYSLAYIMRTS